MTEQRITLCGRLSVTWDGDELGESLPGRQGRLLFAYLALNRKRPVRRDELVEALWADEGLPSGGESLLAPPLSRLRKALGPGRIDGRSELSLTLGDEAWIDWEASQAGIEKARQLEQDGEHAGAYAEAGESERILSGGLLPGLEASWIDEYRNELDELRLQALELLARSGAHLGEAERVRAERSAREAVEAAPFRESARTALIEVMEAQGNVAEALRAYEEFRVLLRDELGTFPAPELNAVHERLLNAHKGGTSATSTRPEPGAPAGEEAEQGPGSVAGSRPATERQATPGEIGKLIDPRITEIELVGREGILEQLNAELDLAVDGDLRIALLAGDGGIGKTRIAAELAAGREDVTVLYGRSEPDEIRPFRIWSGLLRSAMRQAGDISPAEIVGGDGPTLARILPELVRSMELPAPGPAGDLESERRALFGAVMRMIGRFTARQPMLIVLDDLHWADRSTLMLLASLAGDNPPSGVLALGIYRDTELPEDSLLPETLANLQRRLPTLKMRVEALDTAQVGELVGNRLDETLAASLHDQTGGNPFLIEQLVRHLEETGVRDPDTAPAEIRQIISQRVNHLPEGGPDLLRRAALIGRDFDLQILMATTSLDEDAVIDLLDSAVSAGMLDESPSVPGRYSFVHALLRSTLEDELSLTRRAMVHREIGEAIERQTSSRPERRVGEKAWHFAQAGPAEADRAVHWATQAAEQAEGRLAYDEAVDFYEGAIAAARADEPVDQGLLARLLLSQANAKWKNGALQDAGDTFMAAAKAARDSGLPELAATAAIGSSWGGWDAFNVDTAEQLMLMRQALGSLPPVDSPLRAELMAMLGHGLYYGSGQAAEARELAHGAIAMMSRVYDLNAEFGVMQATAFIRWEPQNLKSRLPAANRMVELGEEIGDPELVAQGLASRALALLNLGRGAEAEADRSRQHAMSTTLPQIRFIAGSMQAVSRFLTGEWEEGERILDDLVSSGMPFRGSLLLQDAYGFMVGAQQGRLPEQIERLELFEQGSRGWEMWPTWRFGLLLAKAQAGRLDEVREEIDELGYESLDETREFNSTFLPFCAVGNFLAGELDDREGAKKLIELLDPFAGEWIMIGRIGSTLGPVEMHLGELHLLAGNDREAATALERSLVTCEAMNAAPYLARTKLALANALERLGDPDGEERRSELRDEGSVVARRLDMQAIVRRHLPE
ncbi:MAG: AAA family ATPase [Solirubrobacterales bacterium]|nr:AAA family ATPase [Solirubrobacterales bacterium]